MFDTGKYLSFRCAITLQLVSDNDTWYVLQAFQQLAEELLRGFFVPAALDQDVQDVAILVYSTPEIVILAITSHRGATYLRAGDAGGAVR